ncbi:MAG TPA: competence/damage-inducible protein A [Flavisolibacter sp.]|jgi:nicotinamide-nucleotide amidase|nr:competence/damage-inducible protein A [Flavisolibacter sp.]
MNDVNASIITIGDELLIGQTIDTNSAFIAQELNKMGVWVRRRVAIADDSTAIKHTLTEEAKESRIIIITGGLGPTADDITKPTLCEYFNTSLVVDEGALKNVTEIFQKLGRPMIERNAKQAEVPESCVVLLNLRGTAPGMWFEKDGVVYVSLPGVPHEMKGLMTHSVLPRLKEQLTLPAVVHRTLLTAGQGESFIAERLVQFEEALPSHIKLAYLPAYGMVRLRLTGKGEDLAQLTNEIENAFTALQSLVAEWMIAAEDVTVPQIISKLLKEKGATLSTAESCTGGYIAHLLTSLPGSSAIFLGAVVAYANSVKENVLGVEGKTLQDHGAVSEQTVIQMAAGVCNRLQTDYAIATSGIMGPDGGSTEKPVGTVWIAVASNEGKTSAQKFHFRFDRMRNIELAANNALLLLRRFLLEQDV